MPFNDRQPVILSNKFQMMGMNSTVSAESYDNDSEMYKQHGGILQNPQFTDTSIIMQPGTRAQEGDVNVSTDFGTSDKPKVQFKDQQNQDIEYVQTQESQVNLAEMENQDEGTKDSQKDSKANKEEDPQKKQGPVRWNFAKKTMQEFNLIYDDIKIKNGATSQHKYINYINMNR